MNPKDWPAWPTDVECRETDGPWARHMMQCYSSRLRDTAEALSDLVGLAAIGEHNCVSELATARAILAQLKQEGLT